MDLLCAAYSNAEEEEEPKRMKLSHHTPTTSSKSSTLSNLHTQTLIPGSYVSKRQRASIAPASLPLSSSPSFTLSGTLLLFSLTCFLFLLQCIRFSYVIQLDFNRGVAEDYFLLVSNRKAELNGQTI
ncbi:unnamed protein product [Lathyrus sativus]|nr:unnamed protein product [Lathyrus sativus]